jgi:CHRD domain
MNLRRVMLGSMVCAAAAGLLACGGGDDDGGAAAATYTVGGNVTGLVGTLTLQLNGANDISLTAPGSFSFAAGLPPGANYTVTANAAQNCNVANGSGTMGASNVTNVTITCTTVVRSATLTGAQENPPTTSTATGRGAVIVDPTTKEITGGITFAGVTPSAGGHHIHQAPGGNPTQNGPVIIALVLAPGGGVATVPPGTILTDAQYAALLAGELYFNVHSAANPGGEIRGQIDMRGGVTAGLASLTGAQEVPPNASTATGRGMIVFDSTTRDVLIAYTTHNVAGASVAHIHTGAPGVSGPANVITLNAAGTSAYTAPHPTTLTTQNVTDLTAGNTYFNVHSPTFAAGEIRGQIAVQ